MLYPTAEVVRLALRGAAAYRLARFDAHLLAYAEHFGMDKLYSEDVRHDRLYGTVRVIDPFAERGVDHVHRSPSSVDSYSTLG